MISLVFLPSALAFLALANAHSFYLCEPCRGEECEVRPVGCKYDMAKNPCGRWQCMSGPGERCGGRDNYLGKCGNGMTCVCNKCRGCSTDQYNRRILDCYTTSFPTCL